MDSEDAKDLAEFMRLTKEVFPEVYETFKSRIEESLRDDRVLQHFYKEVNDNPTRFGAKKLLELAERVEHKIKRLLLDLEEAARADAEAWDDDDEWEDDDEE